MAKDILQIVVDFAVKGQNELKQAAGGMDGIKDKAAGFGKALGVAGVGLATVSAAAYGTWQALEAGGALETTRTQFDNLTNSIGSTSGALLGDLRSATKGMMSDAALMSSANDIISLGLANSSEGVTRMATAVGALNLDMQVLGLTLANNSAARLDSLGLSLESVKQKAEELKASGFVGDAFDEAVLIGLEERMTLLGDASQTTEGKMAMLKTTGENIKNAALESFAVALADGLDDATLAAGGTEAALVDLATQAGVTFGGVISGIGDVLAAYNNLPDGLKSAMFGGVGIAVGEAKRGYDAFSTLWEDPVDPYGRENETAAQSRGRMRGGGDYTSPYAGYSYSGNNFAAATGGYTGGSSVNDEWRSVMGNRATAEDEDLKEYLRAATAAAEATEAATTSTMSYGGGGYSGGGRSTVSAVGIDLEEQQDTLDEFIKWAEEKEPIKLKVEFVGTNGETLQDALVALGEG